MSNEGWHLHERCFVVHRNDACPTPGHAMNEWLIPVTITAEGGAGCRHVGGDGDCPSTCITRNGALAEVETEQ